MTDRSTTLPAADSAWLRMDHPTNPMIVTAIMTFGEGLDFDGLTQRLEERFLIHEPFRHRIEESAGQLGKPRWKKCHDLRITDHVHRVRLPDPANKQALQQFVSEVMSTSLDLSRPLWQFHFVDNFTGGSALVARIHHCLGDGMALMRVLLDLTDERVNGTLNSATYTWKAPSRGASDATRSSPLLRLAKIGAGSARILGKLVTMRADPPTVFKGDLGPHKAAAWSDEIPLADIKAIGQYLGSTVNDVLTAAVAGALRSYLERSGDVPEALNLRAVVPVNLRPPDHPKPLGNEFGLVFLSLPVGLKDRVQRVLELKRRMDQIKHSPEAHVIYALLKGIGATASALEAGVVRFLGRTATAVMTNVPGPREPLYVCGTKIENLMFWVPQSGSVSLGVSILSYAGSVRVGIATDSGLVPDPGAIVQGFHEAVNDLMAVTEHDTLATPWDDTAPEGTLRRRSRDTSHVL